jgi:hypothetical protein
MSPYYCSIVGTGKQKKPYATLAEARVKAQLMYVENNCKRDIAILETTEIIRAPKVAE